MNNYCKSNIPTCKCNYGGNIPDFGSQDLVRPNLGSIELDYNVEMPTNFIQGLNGKSAYEYAVKGGYEYSEEQFYKDLAGVGGIEAPELRLVASSIKIGEDITVFTGDDNVSIGGYRNGDVIPANATLLDVLKGLFKRIIEYIYTDPVISISLTPVSSGFTDEVTPMIGEPVYLLLTVNFTRNDAGFVNSVKLTKDNGVIFEETDYSDLSQLNRSSVSDVNVIDKITGTQSFRISTGLNYGNQNYYVAKVDYDAGAIHCNSVGEESPGSILAGTSSNQFVINAIYPVLYRCSDFVFTSDNLISNLMNRNIYGRLAPDKTEDHKCEFQVPNGTKSIAIAIPSYVDTSRSVRCSVRDVVFDKLSAGMDTLSRFTSIERVDGADIQFMGVKYIVYYLNLDSVISIDDTCRVILNYNQ